MSHSDSKLGNFTAQDAPAYEAVLQCMRCGFCLPTCPTYALTGRERSSPRGRVALARAVAEQQLEFTGAVKEEAFFCLDCRACATACPSGVRAGEVMEVCRSQAHHKYPLGHVGKSFREFILQRMLPNPDLLEKSMLSGRLYQRLGIQWLVRHSRALKLGPTWLGRLVGEPARAQRRSGRVARAGGPPRRPGQRRRSGCSRPSRDFAVEVQGVPALDPQQTTLPAEWRHLPAYAVVQESAMTLAEKHRGDADPPADELALERTLWLDFAGTGYTFHDRISGRLSRGWRLDMPLPSQLGRVSVDGVEQLIGRVGADSAPGVELRKGIRF